MLHLIVLSLPGVAPVGRYRCLGSVNEGHVFGLQRRRRDDPSAIVVGQGAAERICSGHDLGPACVGGRPCAPEYKHLFILFGSARQHEWSALTWFTPLPKVSAHKLQEIRRFCGAMATLFDGMSWADRDQTVIGGLLTSCKQMFDYGPVFAQNDIPTGALAGREPYGRAGSVVRGLFSARARKRR